MRRSKAFTVFFMMVTLMFTMTACGNENEQQTTDLSKNEMTANEDGEDTMKNEDPAADNILVAYFSATGTTKSLAQYAAHILNADSYEIVPEDPYTEEDLAYDTDGRADREQKDSSARPAIAGGIEHMERYDTIIVGYPIWHGQAPKIINTFLESYDFSGKTILPFCTSHSSGLGSSDTDLHPLASNSKWLEGRRFAAGASREDVEAWLDEMKIVSANTGKANSFDLENRTVMLNSGYEMPVMGPGTYSLSDEECYDSVTALLEAGGRLIDTAYMYHNEEAVGRAVRDSEVPREDALS